MSLQNIALVFQKQRDKQENIWAKQRELEEKYFAEPRQLGEEILAICERIMSTIDDYQTQLSADDGDLELIFTERQHCGVVVSDDSLVSVDESYVSRSTAYKEDLARLVNCELDREQGISKETNLEEIDCDVSIDRHFGKSCKIGKKYVSENENSVLKT